jgi:hypothetical protein
VVTLEPRSEDGTEGHREFKLKNTLKCTLWGLVGKNI